jgi:hypothetical protein
LPTAAEAALFPSLPFGSLTLLPRELLQVIAHGLVQAFAHALGSQAGFFNGLGVCGQGDVHKFHTGYVQKI